MDLIGREWPDEHAIQAVARRIERFGWPYKQNSEAIVRQVVVELRKLEPPQPQGAVATRDAMTTKLAAILRLTYDERMPDDLADVIRPLCAHPGGQ